MSEKIKLKYINPELFVSKSVAVVGSSKIIKEKEWGKEIDFYDDVIRFNRAPTEGFEKYVGSKTTIRVANHHVFVNTKITDKRFPNPEQNYPQFFIKNQRHTNIVNISGTKNEGWKERSENVHESCKSFLFDFNTANPVEKKIKTVGFIFVETLIKSGIVPDLYGFGISENSDSSHYWTNRSKKSVSHDYANERGILKKWNKEGKIIIHI